MRPMRATVALVLALVAALAIAGCSQTVSGHGSPGGSAGPQGPSGPSSPPASSSGAPESTPPPAAHLACPHVVDPAAGLAYDCVVAGMDRTSNALWPLKFEKEVDVQWTMDEGSGSAGTAGGQDVAEVATRLATEMERSNYGPTPRIKKEHDTGTTVDGKKAHLFQALMTIDPTYRKSRHLKVTQEQLWIVTVQRSAGQIAAWYISVPSVQKALWPKVADLIKSIKVV